MAAAAGEPEERVLAAMESAVAASALSLDTPLLGVDGREADSLAKLLGADEPAPEYLRLQDTIRRAVERLEPRLQSVIKCRFYGEATQKETAAPGAGVAAGAAGGGWVTE